MQDTSLLDQYESFFCTALSRFAEFSRHQAPYLDYATRQARQASLYRACEEAWNAFECAYRANPPSSETPLVWLYLSEDERRELIAWHTQLAELASVSGLA